MKNHGHVYYILIVIKNYYIVYKYMNQWYNKINNIYNYLLKIKVCKV